MAKYKAGLQKKISAIFDGVSIPKNDNTGQLPAASEGESPDCASPKPSIIGQLPAASEGESPDCASPKPSIIEQLPAASGGESADCASPKPSIIEQSPSSSLSSRQSTQPLPKAVSSEQPVNTETAVKNSRRIPWDQYWKQIENKLFAPKAGVNANKHKAIVISMPFLLIIFIFVIVRVSSQPSPKVANAQNLGAENVAGDAAISEKKINWQIPEPYPTTLRDPMQAGLSAAGQGGGGNLIVKGIVYSEDRPSAVVGSQIVHQGDNILGATVVKINQNNVEFEMDGKKWTQEVQR